MIQSAHKVEIGDSEQANLLDRYIKTLGCHYRAVIWNLRREGVYMDRTEIFKLYLNASEEVKNLVDDILKVSESQIEHRDQHCQNDS